MNEKNKKILGICILAVTVIMVIFVLGKKGGTEANSDEVAKVIQKTNEKIDLSEFRPNVGAMKQKEKTEAKNQNADDISFDAVADTSAAAIWNNWVHNAPEIPEMPEFQVYVVEKDGRRRQVDGPGWKDGRPSEQPIVKQQASPRRSGAPAASPAVAKNQQTVVNQQIEQLQPQVRQKSAEELLAEEMAAAFSSEKNTAGAGTVVDNRKQNTNEVTAIKAVVHGEQRLASGSRIKLRTTAAGQIASTNIPANTFLYGIVTFGANRATVAINRAVVNGRDIQINCNVYDASDGGAGLYIEGLKNATAIGEGKSEAVNEVQNVIAASGTGALGRMANAVIRTTQNGQQEIILSNNHKLLIK